MSELFAWVPWFMELAGKIADGGPKFLAERARTIPWNQQGESALVRYGDENTIDPFSFFRFLASKNESRHWERVHPATSQHFGLTTRSGRDFDKGFYFPAAKQQLLFHNAGVGDPALFWRLFRAAIQGPGDVIGADFDAALAMPGVAMAKLTQTLFLINPKAFLPFDEQSLLPLRPELRGVHDWTTSRQELEAVRKMFPGCEPYEIQHFAYAVFGRKELDVRTGKVWQSSTLVDGDQEESDYWHDFRENGWIYHRGPGERRSRRLHEPAPGDLVLVRTRASTGRGIAVVHRNDHKEQWAPQQRLHVLWLNTADADVGGHRAMAFSEAGKWVDWFRGAQAYAPTFALLQQLGWKLKNGHIPPTPVGDLESLANETLIPESQLREIQTLLDDKKQVIFQGPPGTGKTYLAKKLAACLAGDAERVRLVQFHPSYAYEDFVQGYRPTLTEDGRAGFKLRNGPLLKMAKTARKEKDAKFFLVVDEINRGNLSKILGELYFLLEYRDEEIRLQYSDQAFSLPPNLYIIGTMNTADRSIALVDLALRRRFHFVEFRPDKPPIEGLLGRWLDRHAQEMQWVARVVERANEKLDDRHASIGPSYFMREGLNDAKVRMIWEHNVLPYVEERLFGQEDRLKEFSLDRLRNEAEGHPPQPGNEANSDASGAGASGNEAD